MSVLVLYCCLFSWRYNPVWLYFSQPRSGLQPPHSRGFLITHNNAPQSVEFLWTSDQSVAETSTWQHTTLSTDKHPCPRWDSNPHVLYCTLQNKLYGNSSPSYCHLYSAEVNLGGCRLKDDLWTEVSVKWPWRIAENTDFCEQGVEEHFVSGTLWKCRGIKGQFIVNRTLETNMTQNMCTVI